MKYLRLFQTVAEKQAATLDYPNVNYTIENDSLEIIAEDPVQPFGGLTVKYNIVDATQEVTLFNGGGASSSSSSSSSSESGGGGVLPSKMYVDGAEETPINTWRFETAGEHIVQYEFADNIIPAGFLNDSVATATEAIIGDDITTIGNSTFYGCTGLTSITIPDSVTSIGYNAFGNCTGLTSITIPDSVTSIGGGAFINCRGLTSVTISDGVTSIGEGAFRNCRGLTSVTIPDSVTSIGNSVFQSCTNLTSVTIGSAVTSIGEGAFRECSGLTSMTVEATTPPTLGSNALADSSITDIYVPASAVEAYKTSTSTGWYEYASIIQPIV